MHRPLFFTADILTYMAGEAQVSLITLTMALFHVGVLESRAGESAPAMDMN